MHTLLIEVKVIVDSPPLTTGLLSDVKNTVLLRPINLFSLKSRLVMPPPGLFTARDIVVNIGKGCSTSPMSFRVDG